MRTIHTTIACCVFVLAAGPVVLTHCGGSSSSPPAKSNSSSGGSSSGSQSSSSGGGSSSGSSGGSGDDGGGGSGSGGGSSSGSSGDDGGTVVSEGGSSGGGEGGGSSSGGPVTPVPEGGVPSDPGVLACGATTCDTTNQHCCVEGDGGTCQPLNGSCGTNHPSLSCKEAADCASGNACCTALAYGTNTTTCTAGGCAAGQVQLCRTDAECGSADAGAASQQCIVQTCYTSEAMTTTVTVEACAYPVPSGRAAFTWGPLPGCH